MVSRSREWLKMDVVPSTFFFPDDSLTDACYVAATLSNQFDSNNGAIEEAKSIFHLVNDVDSSHPGINRKYHAQHKSDN